MNFNNWQDKQIEPPLTHQELIKWSAACGKVTICKMLLNMREDFIGHPASCCACILGDYLEMKCELCKFFDDFLEKNPKFFKKI